MSGDERARFRASLERVGVTGLALERALEAQFGPGPRANPAGALEVQRIARLEKIEQNDIRKLWITMGGRVWCTSAVTPAKITPGYADLLLTWRAMGLAIDWETKATVGRIPPEQQDFLGDRRAAGGFAGAGTFADFVGFVRAIDSWRQPVWSERELVPQLEAALDRAGLALLPEATASGWLPEWLLDPYAPPPPEAPR
jgi:hypothetical protein